MPLPGFLGPSTLIPPAPRALARAPALAPTSGKLAFKIQPQLQSNWCWAAVSTSVSHFFSVASAWTQCLVANTTLPRTDCCGAGAADPAKCNTYGYLDQALTTTGNLRQMQARPLSFAEVQTEIGASKPVGSRVGWFGGGGHFMAIVGWLVADSGEQYLDIADPIFLDSQIPFNSYASAYQSGGDWTHSYLTQAPQAQAALGGNKAAMMAAQNVVANVDLSSIGA
jgi:Papain-like cysteine protease AvrRpt2